MPAVSSQNVALSRLAAVVVPGLMALGAIAAKAEPVREIFVDGDVRIEVIAEGSGPLIVMLPSRGRGAEDFDEVAAGLAKAGFRISATIL